MGFKYRIKQHINENRWQYYILILLFILGIAAGNYPVSYLEEGVKSHLLEMIDNYLRSELADTVTVSFWAGAFINQFKTLLVIWFLGLTVIGLPLILGIVFVRGFSLGFTVGFLVHEKAGAGIVLILLSIVPQNLVYIPLFLIWSVIAMNFSIYLVKGRTAMNLPLAKALTVYTSLMLIGSAFLLAGSLIETYLSPWLLSLLL